MATVYIGLGSNLGKRARTLQAAVERINWVIDVAKTSSVYETEPIGGPDQSCYLNAVVCGTTALTPGQLLAALKQIEDEFDRERPLPNAPRTLDLDVLLYDDVVLEEPDLIIPHPRLHERAFVLVPLAEIAPDVVHPTLDRSVTYLLDHLSEPRRVVPTEYPLRAE